MSMAAIETLIRERLGLDPAALGPTAFPCAVEKRMSASGETTTDAYLRYLSTHTAEISRLGAELVVAETWFFRGGRALFDRLAEIVATQVPPIRILSLPCSTGEEPYSLVIALQERRVPPNAYHIDAVDLSPRHLERAAAGRFPAFSFREPGPDIRPIHFTRQTNDWELAPHLRSLVHFRTGNVTDPNFLAGEAPYNLILCRNLFIYLTAESRAQAMAALDRLLAPDGWLCLSPGEADRLPAGRFVTDGPSSFGLYRRSGTTPADAIHEPRKPTPTWPPRLPKPLPAGVATSPPALVQTPLPPEPLPAATSPLVQARALADAGNLPEARIVCERLLGEHVELADAHALLGVIHEAQGNIEQATEEFRKALYLAPGHIEALTQLVVLCERRGDLAQANLLRKRLARATLGDMR